MKRTVASESNRQARRLARLEAGGCALLSLLFCYRNGLPLGAGNQSLQWVWLERLRDPSLYAGDPLLESFRHFPSAFFPALASMLPDGLPLGPLLQGLQLLNTFFLFLGGLWLTRSLFPRMRLPLLVPAFLAFGPLRALAETPLPPVAFTHTAFGLTLALCVLTLGFRGRLFTALCLLAVLLQVHLLTAAYTAVILGLFLLPRGRRLFSAPLLAGAGVCLLSAFPLLRQMLLSSGVYDAEWIALLRERSAHHVFPGSWWRAGDPSWGQFLLRLGWLMAFVAWLPRARNSPALRAMALGPLLCMLIGTLGSELQPVPLILRAQLFRTSQFLLLLSLIVGSAGLERMWRTARGPAAPLWRLGPAALWCYLLLPGNGVGGGWLLAGFSLWNWGWGRLRGGPAWVLATIFVLLTRSDLQLGTAFWRLPAPAFPEVELWLPLAFLTGLLLLFLCRNVRLHRAVALGLPVLLMLWIGQVRFPLPERDAWRDIQEQTQRLTPGDAILLTPVRQSGFRMGTRRAVVGEWRDGTMQFFDPAFARGWAERMRRLETAQAESQMPSDWVEIATSLGATHLVLPREQAAGLVRLAGNREWVLYEARLTPPPPLPPPPENAVNPEDWLAQERFMLEVVEPNIERNRKRTLALRLRDEEGVPMSGMRVEVEQLSLDFGIGSTLHHFHEVARSGRGFHAPQVDPRELEHFPELFNYSVIGFSGKWNFIEPVEGERNYADLDAYVDWCVRHGIRLQYHFVSGYEPPWLRRKSEAEQRQALLRHAEDLIARYGDRISDWQIINEQRLQKFVPEVFALFREKLPHAILGVSHCARFYTHRDGEAGEKDLKRGWDSMEQIERAGQQVDFFGIHAHRPFGTWWDPREMYRVMDDFQERGVRVHVTETGISHAGKIEGGVLSGEWTPELQADYLERFFKVCFSHPNVDVINFWGFGPLTWQENIGLLDADFQPRPAYETLRRLMQEDWRTRLRLRSDARGELRVRGFYGGYRIQVLHPDGRRGQGEFRLEREGPEMLEVTLRWSDPAYD